MSQDRTGLSSSNESFRSKGTSSRSKSRGAIEIQPPWVIETARLRIRPLRPNDRSLYVQMLRESRAGLDEYLAFHEPGETDDSVFERHLALAHASAACPDIASRRVIEHGGRLIGAININDIQGTTQRSGELVLWITASSAGFGFGTEAIRAVSSHVLSPSPHGMGLDLVYALVAPGNHGALRVLERTGFVEAPNVPLVELRLGSEWRAHCTLIREATNIASNTPTNDTSNATRAAQIVVRRLMASASRTG